MLSAWIGSDEPDLSAAAKEGDTAAQHQDDRSRFRCDQRAGPDANPLVHGVVIEIGIR